MSNAEYFSVEDPHQPPRRNTGCTVAGVLIGGLVGGGVVLVLACCGGLIYFGTNILAEQVADDLRDNPVIEEHIGPITSISTSWAASAAAGEEEFVFEVEGPKGKGRIKVVTITRRDDTEDVVSGTLQMANGERYDLFPDEEEEVVEGPAE